MQSIKRNIYRMINFTPEGPRRDHPPADLKSRGKKAKHTVVLNNDELTEYF